jgi:hypothetical protein
MAPKKKVERPQENVSLGPQVREGELVFGTARIFASKLISNLHSIVLNTDMPCLSLKVSTILLFMSPISRESRCNALAAIVDGRPSRHGLAVSRG